MKDELTKQYTEAVKVDTALGILFNEQPHPLHDEMAQKRAAGRKALNAVAKPEEINALKRKAEVDGVVGIRTLRRMETEKNVEASRPKRRGK